MLEDQKNIDEVFTDGLGDFSVAPPAYVWTSIESSLEAQRKQKRTVIVWRSIAAACVALLVGVSVAVMYQSPEMIDAPLQAANTNSAEQIQDVEHVDVSESKSSIAYKQQPGVVNSGIVPVCIDEVKLPAERSKPIVAERNYQTAMVSRKEVNLTNGYDVNTELHVHKEKVYYPLFASNQVASSSKKTSISVGGLLTPAYNSKTSSGGQTQAMRASGNQVDEKGINSLGGGIQVRINRGTRWSFETGVLYAQVGQKVNNSMPEYTAQEHALASPVIRSSGVDLTNSMGNVAVNKSVSPPGTLDYSNENISDASIPYFDGLKQTLEYLEVPMMVRYSLFKEFPYISLAGGFSSNFLVGNTAYVLNDNGQQEIGETKSIKPFMVSSSVGVGVDVPLSKVIRLNVEPRFKYFLNSVSSDSDFSFQPYSFGVYGGITFVIK